MASAMTTMMGHACADEEERLPSMRAMSLPDMTELTDIVALDEVLSDEDDEREEDSHVQNHPMRLFSVGLQRSMSMPKQQQKKAIGETKQEENDDFYFPDDESTHSEVAQDSFLPKFYSNETLAGVLPPLVPSPKLNANKPKQVSERRMRKQSTEDGVPDAEKESITGSLREAAAKKSAQREAALSSLSAFFGGGTAEGDTTTSPTSVITFPAPQEAKSGSMPSCTEAGESSKRDKVDAVEETNSPPRRSIFSKSYTESSSSSSSDFEFKMLQGKDRTTSMPAKLPSSKMPRKPSLKKVSSFVGNTKADSSGGDNEMKPSVSFSNLQIREYDVTLGDHPNCSIGPPVSLGWDYQDAEVVPLEKYERARERKPRRNSRQLVLSYNVRKYLLLKTAGYTKAELREAMKEVDRIKHERKMTDMMLPLDEVMEGVIDHVKGMFQQK